MFAFEELSNSTWLAVPHSDSNRRFWPKRQSPPSPAATDLPMRSSPSWKAFDYANPDTEITPVCKDFHTEVGITRRSA